MKTKLALSMFLAGTLFGAAPPQAPSNPVVDSTVQAIQQTTDPSAAIAAYANAIAVDRNQPKVYEAYVARMVEFGLPEMAYHQAQTLTGLNSSSGLAWGVIAYVDARRGDMPEALAAINLAGQNAPDNKFIQRTAGEVLAWYDLQADKSKLPDQTKAGLAKIRSLLYKRPDYIAAYDSAKKAYQSNPNGLAPNTAPYSTQPSTTPGAYVNPIPGESTQPQVIYTPSYYPPYYPPYYAYAPWWGPDPWWWPSGLFIGFNFFPFHDHFHHDHFHHDHFFHGHDHFALHDGHFFGHAHFFGMPASPNSAHVNHGAFVNGSSVRFSFNTGAAHWNTMPGAMRNTPSFAARSGMIRGFNPAPMMGARRMPMRTFSTPPQFVGPRFGSPGAQHFAMRGGGGFHGGMGGFHGGGGHGGGHR